MNYTYVEEYIFDLFTSIGITHSSQLNMYLVAAKLGVSIIHYHRLLMYKNEIFIESGTSQEEWQAFGHEICHHLRHCGNQLVLHPLFVDLQEMQAEYFSLHFCVPTFMLEQIELSKYKKENIYLISQTFNVDYQFAEKRLDVYLNKKCYFGGMINGKFSKTWENMAIHCK